MAKNNNINNNPIKIRDELKGIPKFIVNLDDTPERRWSHIINIYKPKFQNVINVVDKLLSGVTGTFLKWLTWWHSDKVFYIDELKAISKESGFELEKLILLQLCYELCACCTSIIINNGDNMVHYRTMDWELPELTDLTIKVDFVKGGIKLFSATTWAGYVGVMTAVKQGVCTIALNYRRLGNSVFTNYYKSLNGAWPVGFLIRHLLETENSYTTIKHYLKKSTLISPCYLTMSGCKNSEGVIIGRTRDGTDFEESIKGYFGAYIVQTNIDNSKLFDNAEPDIVYSKRRIRLTKQCMENYEQVSDIRNLLNRFDTFPIINETTIYVTIMDCSSPAQYIPKSDKSMFSYVIY